MPGKRLRVIEGGRGNGAPEMWHRLYELHAKEEARTITEAEWQEMRGIERTIGVATRGAATAAPHAGRQAVPDPGRPF